MADKSDDCFVGLQQFVDLVREDNTPVNNHPTRKIQAMGAFASHQEAPQKLMLIEHMVSFSWHWANGRGKK